MPVSESYRVFVLEQLGRANDLIPVCVEGAVRQVDPDIYEFCNWFYGAHVAREAQEAFAAI